MKVCSQVEGGGEGGKSTHLLERVLVPRDGAEDEKQEVSPEVKHCLLIRLLPVASSQQLGVKVAIFIRLLRREKEVKRRLMEVSWTHCCCPTLTEAAWPDALA